LKSLHETEYMLFFIPYLETLIFCPRNQFQYTSVCFSFSVFLCIHLRTNFGTKIFTHFIVFPFTRRADCNVHFISVVQITKLSVYLSSFIPHFFHFFLIPHIFPEFNLLVLSLLCFANNLGNVQLDDERWPFPFSPDEAKCLRQTESNDRGLRGPRKEIRVEGRQSLLPEAELVGTVTYSLMEILETLARLAEPRGRCVSLRSPEAHSEALEAGMRLPVLKFSGNDLSLNGFPSQ
jgi:hypothetical protein